MKNRIKFIFLSLPVILMPLYACNAEGMLTGPLDKANIIVDKFSGALTKASTAANNIAEKGIILHFGSDKIIPQMGFAGVGVLSSVCGLVVITHTALEKDQTDANLKYVAGAGMLGVGIASLAATAYLADK